MKHLRLVGLGAAVLAFAGQSLVGQTRPAPSMDPGGGPFDSLHFRSIGPASMSGRISDVAVYEANPAVFYVGTAHGGLWKTTNNGTTFDAQFQDQGLISIGDVAVSPSNPDLVWVGTGESNNRQSTSWGDGVYKSTDGGKTWAHVGLKTSRYINRIVIDPRATDTVLVAATGSLWGPGGERGVYKTTDGGKTWKQVLKVDEDTGANDLVMDPDDSRIVYASTYQRRRTACCMNGGGPGSGLWKSTDGGDTWTRLESGIPEGPLGRIAVDVYRKRPNILYALIEGPAPQGRGGRGAAGRGAAPAAVPAQFGRGGGGPLNDEPTGLYRSDDSGATWKKVNNANPRPMYFSQVRIDPNDPEVVYLGGVGLHQTTDGGKTIATDVARPTHDDVHAIWIDPSNSDHVIIGNDGGLAYSYDMAKTWVFVPNLPVGLFYHVSYDMATPYNVCGGMQDNYNWCGPSAVRGSAGIANYQWQTLQGGDGFVVLQDPTDYRIFYSETQDGNMVRGDRVTGETVSIRPQPAAGEPPFRWQWDTPLVLSPLDHKVIYAAAQKVFRSADRGLTWTAVSPDLTNDVNRDEVVTMGLKGSDITISKNDGISAFSTIVQFAESPKRAGLYYAGTDDGNVQVSRDAGKTWTNVTPKIPGAPKNGYVSEVAPSRFDEGTVYVTFDDHRQDNFDTYVYVSTDYGQTFQSLASNLKGEVVKTLTEDLKNPDVLYVGTETGLFATIDWGRTWNRLKGNFPTVRVDEITLHPRDNAMLIATHGRAIWILDHLEPIQEYAAAQATTADAKLFSLPPTAMYRRPARDRNYEFWGDQNFFGENPPQAAVISWFNRKDVGAVSLTITDALHRDVREISGPVLVKSNTAGLQAACWDLRVQPIPAPAGRGGTGRGGGRQGGAGEENDSEDTTSFGAGCSSGGGGGGFGGGGGGGTPGPFVLPGVYTVALVIDGKTVETKPLRVMADPEVALTELERRKMYDMAMEMHELQTRGAEIATSVQALQREATAIATAIGARTDVPAEVKASFDAFNKELTALAPKFAAPAGGRGGGRGAAPTGDQPIARAAQAKNGLMATMPLTEGTTKAYADAKAQMPKAVTEANAVFGKAATLAPTLAKYNLTLTPPPQIRTDGTKSSLK